MTRKEFFDYAEANKLVNKEISGEGNMLEKKLDVQNQFLNFIKIEKDTGRNAHIENGIIIYGNSTKKDEFISHFSF